MKTVIFVVVSIACAIPAFAQGTAMAQSSTVIPGSCQGAYFAPSVPSAVVVLTVPTAPRSGYGPGSLSTVTAPRGSAFSVPSPGASGIAGFGTLSGVGGMTSSGIGSMERSGIGVMERSGIGSIGAPGFGLVPTAPAAPVVAVPIVPSSGVYSQRSHGAGRPGPGAASLAFICP